MLTLAISPCPNDTFIFDAIFHKRINLEGIKFNFQFHDVETLNHMAMVKSADMLKVSFFTYMLLQEDYVLLDSVMATDHFSSVKTIIPLKICRIFQWRFQGNSLLPICSSALRFLSAGINNTWFFPVSRRLSWMVPSIAE
jgi:hypothetical protein